MTAAICIVLALAGGANWQSYTSTNFINDLAGSDTLLILATRGGVYELDISLDPPPVGAARRPGSLDSSGFRLLRTVTNSEGLPANACNALALDPAGNTWVGTEGGGLGIILPDSARGYRPPPAMPEIPETITALARAGTRLLLGTQRGFYVIETFGTWLDDSDDIVYRFTVAGRPELLSDRVYSVAAVGGSYWVGTNVGVTSVDPGFTNWRAWRRPLGDSVKAIAGWRDTVLVGTELGVARLRDTSFVPVFRFDPPRRVFDLEPSDPNLYIATDTGVFTLQRLDSTTLRRLTGHDCRTVYAGRGIWIGRGGALDRGEGLRYLLPGQPWWETYYSPGIATNQITGTAFSPVTGKLYACHYRSSRSISVIDPESRTVEVLPGALTLPLQLACDSRGRVWCAHFANDGGLSRYDPATEKWDTLQWGASSGWNIVTAFGIDHNDTKWMFNADGVVVALDSNDREVSFDIPGLAPTPGGGYDFATDRRGRAWLGLTVGLVMIDYAGTLHDRSDDRYAVLTEGLPSREIRSVAVDADDNVWVATSQGAAVWNGERFRVYNVAGTGGELLSNDVHRVRVDRAGRVWFLTEGGLAVYDPVFRRWNGHPRQRSGLIANPEGMTGFYTAFDIDRARGRVAVGTLRGLSVLDLGTEPVPPDDAALRVYPNPCIIGIHDEVKVDSLPEDTRVEVRTISGRLVAETRVREGRREAVWRPADVASGVYLLVVRGPTGSRLARVAVIRP